MSAGFAVEFTDVETGRRDNRPVLSRKDTVEILLKEVLLACNQDFTFCRRRGNGRGVACHRVNIKWFETVKKVTVQRVMCSKKPKVDLNEKERN